MASFAADQARSCVRFVRDEVQRRKSGDPSDLEQCLLMVLGALLDSSSSMDESVEKRQRKGSHNRTVTFHPLVKVISTIEREQMKRETSEACESAVVETASTLEDERTVIVHEALVDCREAETQNEEGDTEGEFRPGAQPDSCSRPTRSLRSKSNASRPPCSDWLPQLQEIFCALAILCALYWWAFF